ncbi:short-chain dehydrogenase/reductase-like protein SDR [Glonium stellatum]|uniref:Short-chain dehydrogenase/reductase-like protein SDR n=1 Tax=Glonium stellatum TaxID=574774 RepID=A0A8E2FBG4_9PEZI|nr:short-chain dehydrogenase/reductase-like protein SDR [Glonium stellatum]
MTTQLLAGKICAITGGVTGIGRAIALEYIGQGARVAVNHFGDAKSGTQFQSMLSEAAESKSSNVTEIRDRLIEVPGDISQQETGVRLVQAAVEKWGRLDVFVSNAGVCEFSEFLDISKTLFDQTVSINLSGSFYATQAAARQMATQQPSGGSIIGISSISALVGGGRQAHYTPTKAGVLSLMQSAACALGRHGIRCNALLPGTIRTQLNEEDLADDEKRRYMEGRIPLGRTGVPADLAGPAVFLASGLSGYVTGAQLLVDGGLFVNLQ